ncbi:MAG: hypothetical protein KC609_15670 [Myxococcales bacterium]|nr:hypothetical protein [Myxococcales bacterium]
MTASVRMCERHPAIQANLECEACGRPICPRCVADSARSMVCDDCYVPERPQPRIAVAPDRPSDRATSIRPRGLTVLGVVLIVNAVMPLLAPHEPKAGYSMVFVGLYLTGSTARAGIALHVLLSAFLGIGILRGWRSAWPLSIGYFALMIANTTSLVLLPSLTARWLKSLPPEIGKFSAPEVYFFLALQAAIHVVVLRYVYRRRGYFETTTPAASSNH